MNKAYLGLGTNMGNRENYLREAVEIINNNQEIKILKVSKVYETKAWGLKEQDDFLNLCVEIETELNPQDLLEVCHKVEEELNRVRDRKSVV